MTKPAKHSVTSFNIPVHSKDEIQCNELSQMHNSIIENFDKRGIPKLNINPTNNNNTSIRSFNSRSPSPLTLQRENYLHKSDSPPSMTQSSAAVTISSALSGAKQLSKLKRFLTTLQQFASDISPEISDRVRHLVLNLIVSLNS